MFFDQDEFDVRCEWGSAGLARLVLTSDAIVIVDVLSFSTCVDVAVGRGALVYPFRWKEASAVSYARSLDAVLANPERTSATGYSLAPSSLLGIPAGTRLVLPSPNGAALTLATGGRPTFAGCLRNAVAVAEAAQKIGPRIGIVPAGERWPDGSLRPALEDWTGAGAIIAHLRGTRSPEASVAEAAFKHVQPDLTSCLERCSSGKELIGRGFATDVALAAALNRSHCAPRLKEGAYTVNP
ncbi:MAG: 2-phosphosulfolactate phosphatase [Ferruginibacter sp.]|nr:2-phosphosulfolactate phosphatase [Cytophagales bacterium]